MRLLADKLDIEFEDEGQGVSADALRELLDRTLAFLSDEPGGSDGVTWRVTHVTMNSPLAMTVERMAPAGAPEPTERPAERLVRVFAALAKGDAPTSDYTPMQIRRVAAIAQVAQPGRKVVFKAGRGKAIRVQADWGKGLKEWMRQKVAGEALPEQHYSVAGRLEGVDVHGRKSEFYVYDPLTDQKMRCLFDDSMLETVKESLTERVEVSGLTVFNQNDEPVRMKVDSLRVISSRPFLSRLKDAQRRGVMRLTGDLSIDDAVNEIRDVTG